MWPLIAFILAINILPRNITRPRIWWWMTLPDNEREELYPKEVITKEK